MNKLALWTKEVAKLEFVHCDMRHEDVYRDKEGKPIPNQFGEKYIIPQCPEKTLARRITCPHFKHWDSTDPIHELYNQLLTGGHTDEAMRIQFDQHQADKARVKSIDTLMRAARTGALLQLGQVPTIDEGRDEAAPLILEHRQIVDRTREFARILLAASEKVTSGE